MVREGGGGGCNGREPGHTVNLLHRVGNVLFISYGTDQGETSLGAVDRAENV